MVRSDTRASICVIIVRIWLSSWAIESIVEGEAGAGVGVTSSASDGRDKAFRSTDALLARGLRAGIAL